MSWPSGVAHRVFTHSVRHSGNVARAAIKPYHDIPTKRSLLPASIVLLLNGGPSCLHEHCDKRHKELGPIFREQLGSNELVFVADTNMIRTVIAHEGSQPHHNVPEAWILYNQIKDIKRGLFFQVGEPWLKLRRALNRVMLVDSHSTTRFAHKLIEINRDLIKHWVQSNGHIVIEDVKNELCKWSIESTGFMLFGQRMGCIPIRGDTQDRRAGELVENVANMFRETSKFQVLPVKLAQRLNLKPWRRFELASTKMLEIANNYAIEYIAKARESDANQSIVNDLLGLNSLTDDEISRSMVDLIIAAADTTSNSLQWLLYLIAKHPEVQERLRRDVTPLINESNFENLRDSAPYLAAFVKEAARLYPTAPFLARTLDHDIALDQFKIPAGVTIVFSLFTTSRMSKYFDDPLEFKPERWLRALGSKTGTGRNNNHAYASLPFGIGSRMCVGRRAADLEMSLIIASIVDQFECRPLKYDDTVRIRLKMILCPDRPIGLRLIARNKSNRA